MKYTGLVIGILLGIVAGFALVNQLKKSQRSNGVVVLAIGLGMVVLGSAGLTIGNNFDVRLQLEKDLGHDKLSENIIKQGRAWVAITKWKHKDGSEYILITGQANDKTLISQLNDEMVYNHEIKSGSHANVSKFHQSAKNQVFEKQKRGFL